MKRTLSIILLAAMLTAVTVSAAVTVAWQADGGGFVGMNQSFGNLNGGSIVVSAPKDTTGNYIGSAEVGSPVADSPYGDSLKLLLPMTEKSADSVYTNFNTEFDKNAVFGMSIYGDGISEYTLTAFRGFYGDASRIPLRVLNLSKNSITVCGVTYSGDIKDRWLDLRFAFDFNGMTVKGYVNGGLVGEMALPATYTFVSYINGNSRTSAVSESAVYLDNFSLNFEETPAFNISTSIDDGAPAAGISEINVDFNQEVICADIQNAVSVVNAMTGERAVGITVSAFRENGYIKGLTLALPQAITGDTGYNLMINGISTLFGRGEMVYEYFNGADGRIFASLELASPYFGTYIEGAKVKFNVTEHISPDMTVKAYQNGSEIQLMDAKAEAVLSEGQNSFVLKIFDSQDTEIYASKPVVLFAEGYTEAKTYLEAHGENGKLGASDGTYKLEATSQDDPYGACYMPDTYHTTNGMIAIPRTVNYTDANIMELSVSYYFVDFKKNKPVWSIKAKHDTAADVNDGRWLNYATVDTNGYLVDNKTDSRYAKLETGAWYDFKTVLNLAEKAAVVFLDGEQLYSVDLGKYNANVECKYVMYPRFVLGQLPADNPSVTYCDNVVIKALRSNAPEISVTLDTDVAESVREGAVVKATVDAWKVPEGGSAVIYINGARAELTGGSYSWNATAGKNDVYAAILDSAGNEIAVSESLSFRTLPKSFGAVREYIINDSYDGSAPTATKGDGSGGGKASVTADPDTAHGNCVKFDIKSGSTGGTSPYIASSNRNAKAYTDKIFGVELDFKLADFNGIKEFVGLKFNDAGNWITAPVKIKEDEKLYVHEDGKPEVYCRDVDKDTWYTLKFVMYTESRAVDIYFKESRDAEYTLLAENQVMTGLAMDNLQYFNINGGSATADSVMYLDNFKVYTLVENDLSILQDISVSNAAGEVSEMKDLSGAFQVNAKLFNGEGNAKTVTVVAAVTDKATGMLQAIQADALEFAEYQAYGEARLAFLEAPEHPENYEIKIFAWDSLGNAAPLDDTIGRFE